MSVFLGPHKAGSGTRPAAVRLRSLIQDARAALASKGMGEADTAALLGPLEQLLGDPELSAGHHESFAIFRNARSMHWFRLPWDEPDSATVDSRFRLVPLIEAAPAARAFLLLLLSRKRVRLLACGPHDCESVDLPGVPASFEEFNALNLSDYKLIGRSPGGNTFGLSPERDKVDRHFHDYCVALGRALAPIARQRAVPLVIAGTADEVTTWRGANPPDNLWAGEVEASPDAGLSDRDLAALARPRVAAWRSPEETYARSLHRRLAGSPRVLREMNAIVAAAAEGRLEHFFFAPGSRVDGDYFRISSRIPLAGEIISRSSDLVNAVAVDMLRHSGHVWPAVPEDCVAAAIARY
ncbi:MAG: hypothetical protein R2729_00370 [Bryobacteraceae bacterium]